MNPNLKQANAHHKMIFLPNIIELSDYTKNEVNPNCRHAGERIKIRR